MPDKIVPYRPVRGVNNEESEDSLGDEEVREATNFLFERREAFTRPGASAKSVTGVATSLRFVTSFRIVATPQTLALGDDGKLYSLSSTLAGTEITGAGTTLGSSTLDNAEAVNGVVLVANNTGGLLRWDPAGFTYTIITAAKYRFVTSHLSRAVAAYDTNASAILGPRTVGWSVAGDETNWAGVGSGSTVLSDAPDDITGLGNVNNVLVIARRQGFHLGLSTGVATPAFRFDIWGRKTAGCLYPSTFLTEDNACYFVGADNVYSFDLSTLNPIGDKIRRELFSYLASGVPYRAFVSRSALREPRLRYNLVPASSKSYYPHFSFDIKEGIWSRHLYPSPIVGGCYRISSNDSASSALFTASNPPTIHEWDPDTVCESESSFLSRSILPGPFELEFNLRRVLLRHRNYSQSAKIRFVAYARADNEAVENDKSLEVGSLTGDEKWVRSWINVGLKGHDFEYRVIVPSNNRFACNYIGGVFFEGGGFRGV